MIPDKDLTDDVLDEIIAGAKTSIEQYLALSLKAEREVWRKEGPTDDERIMAIEGIHNCERCSDEGWIVGEMGITRCACGQAGNSPVIPGAEQRIADAVELLKQAAPAMLADNGGPEGPQAGRVKSPVIPDGYVMVPKEPTAQMYDAGDRQMTTKQVWDAMLAAAQHDTPALNSLQSVDSVAGKWIPVSEHLPDPKSEQRVCVYTPTPHEDMRYRFVPASLFRAVCSDATHWYYMESPAAPQEEK